jgi:hypothetical protein
LVAASGGGGGAASAGERGITGSGVGNRNGLAGDGIIYDTSGAAALYARGGDGGGGATGPVNTGFGGGGGSASPAPGQVGGNGGDGVVIVKYAGPTKATGGDTITSAGGFTTHTFTGAGTFTWTG